MPGTAVTLASSSCHLDVVGAAGLCLDLQQSHFSFLLIER